MKKWHLHIKTYKSWHKDRAENYLAYYIHFLPSIELCYDSIMDYIDENRKESPQLSIRWLVSKNGIKFKQIWNIRKKIKHSKPKFPSELGREVKYEHLFNGVNWIIGDLCGSNDWNSGSREN